jgi:hypothetical protein
MQLIETKFHKTCVQKWFMSSKTTGPEKHGSGLSRLTLRQKMQLRRQSKYCLMKKSLMRESNLKNLIPLEPAKYV